MGDNDWIFGTLEKESISVLHSVLQASLISHWQLLV